MQAHVTVSLELAPFPSVIIKSRHIGAVTRIVLPCLVYWHRRNPNLRSRGTVQFVPERYPARQTIHLRNPLFAVLSYTRERRDGQNTTINLVAEGLSLTSDTFVEEGLRNHWKWNSLYHRRTAPLSSNHIS